MMTTAMVSHYTGLPARDTGMTGEVTLTGFVLPIIAAAFCLASRVMFGGGVNRTLSSNFPLRNEFCTFKMLYWSYSLRRCSL